MSVKSKSTVIGFAILGVLWVSMLVLIWPTSKQDTDDGLPDSGASGTDLQADQIAATLTAIPTSPLPTPTLVPTPTPTPAPFLTAQHVVKPGDTIKQLADQYNTSVDLLSAQISAVEFTPGNVIDIPIPNQALCPSGQVHVVRPNDTLFRLSQCYAASMEAIMEANSLQGEMIAVGTVLCIPSP